MSARWPLSVAISCRVATSQSLSVLSQLPVARSLPSGENAAAGTPSTPAPVQLDDLLPRSDIPQPDRPVVAGRQEPLPIARKGNEIDLLAVPSEGGNLVVSGHVPQRHASLRAA